VRRAVPYLVGAVAVLAVLAPLLGPPEGDSYPLSTYPMFARDGGDTARLPTVVGVDAVGDRHRLSPTLIAGSDEPVLAAETVLRAIRLGRTDRLCEDAAERVGGRHPEVAVITETHDLDRPGEPAIAVEVHAACETTP
jgi:hypothetical protein